MNDSMKNLFANHTRLVALIAAAALAMLTLFLLVKTVDALERVGDSPYAGPNVITVTGTGKAETPPTIANVTFTVEESGATVAEAQDKATKKMDAALEAVHTAGVDDKDVTTSGYNTYPEYEQVRPCMPGAACPTGSPKIIGYKASQTVTVKVRDTEKVGELLQSLGTAGVQNISGPEFKVDDDTTVMQEARGKAIENARENARVLARQLGVRLGDVVSYSDNGNGGYPMPMYDASAKGGVMMNAAREAAAPAIPTGQQESTVTVSVTYEIR